MNIRKLSKRLFLFCLFLTLVLRLDVATSWFFGTAVPATAVARDITRIDLPLGLTFEQLHASLAQFTKDGIVTHEDIGHFLTSAQRGAHITYQLFLAEHPTPLTISTRKTHLSALADTTAFFYLISMLTRDDGLMPADVTFGIVDTHGRFTAFMNEYLNRIRNKRLNLGSEQSLFGANPLAYFRKQSHGFERSWGINMHASKQKPSVPLLFTGRWEDDSRSTLVTGPLYHLLVGHDAHDNKKIYLKPEECGIYHWTEWFGHAKGYLRTVARRTILLNRLFDADDDPPFNKEHTPRAVLQAFKKAARQYARYRARRLDDAEKAAIRRGIAGMYAHARTHEWHAFTTYIEEHFNLPHLRHGNEIIIAPETVFWSIYFTTDNIKIRQMLDALAAIKIFLSRYEMREIAQRTSAIADLRAKIQHWRTLYLDAAPDLLITNKTLYAHFNRHLTLITQLLKMDDAALQEYVARHRYQLFW